LKTKGLKKKGKATKRRKRIYPNHEKAFEKILLDEGVGGWEREYKFYPSRRFQSDFAWPSLKIILEIEGGVFVRGRHVRPMGYEKDCIKYSLAASIGWLVLRFTPTHIKSGEALDILKRTIILREQELDDAAA
jgi:very-short-patch-repair endonuclease